MTATVNTLRVGSLSRGDAGEVLTVQRAAYVTEAQRYAAPGIPPLRETLDELAADLDRPHVLGLGAWLGPRLVGSVRGRLAADAGSLEVARFAVAPDLRGRGIGRTLLAALHAAVPPSVRTLWLVTGARSDDNLRLYAAAGYTAVTTVLDDAGVELVRMERRGDGQRGTR